MIHANTVADGVHVEISGSASEVIRDAAEVVAAAARVLVNGARHRYEFARGDTNERLFFSLIQIHCEAEQLVGLVERGYEGPIPSAYQRIGRKERGADDQGV